jgi:predicted nucleic acid-binding Zn ribbon protein
MRISSRASKAFISQDGRTAMVSVAVSFLQRGGRKQILSPTGAAPWSPAPRVESALVKAVVRAHRWRQMIESGKYASSAELAKAEKVNDSYLSRILRLTLLAPDLIEAILSGRQPSTLQLDELLKPMPAVWSQQRYTLRIPQ